MTTTLETPSTGGAEKRIEPNQDPSLDRSRDSSTAPWLRKTTVIATLSIAAILLHLVLRFGFHTSPSIYQVPLLVTLVVGGLPLLYDLLRKLLKREFGS